MLHQDLIEKVRILGSTRQVGVEGLQAVAGHLQAYAGLLAEQGCACTALKYLSADPSKQVVNYFQTYHF